MPVSSVSWFRPLKKVLIALSILVGLYVFTLVVTRLVLSSLYRGIETQRATGLSAVASYGYVPLPAYQSADGILQAGGISVVRAVSLALEAPSFETAESRMLEITEKADGFLDEFKVHRQADTTPWLEARLRLRADKLDSALTDIRSLGNIRQETESSENTNAEKESLKAQLESKRAELARLSDIVKHHTGSLSDTLYSSEFSIGLPTGSGGGTGVRKRSGLLREFEAKIEITILQSPPLQGPRVLGACRMTHRT